MTLVRAILILALTGTLVHAAPQGQRIWSFTNDKKLTGAYLWSDAEHLYLRSPKGKTRKLPIGLLSNPDLEVVRDIREKLGAEGVSFEAPLVWQSFRSRFVNTLDAERAGAYPLDTRDHSQAKLELEFTRFGVQPPVPPDHKVVLRLGIAARGDAGTNSTLRIAHRGRIVGSASGIRAGATIDIPLPAHVLAGPEPINLALTCGSDAVHIRTGKAGCGPRLLVTQPKVR